MRIISQDLRELSLRESDLNGILWRAETVEGFHLLQESIRQQYAKLLQEVNSAQIALVRALVSTTITLGAVRGVQWGHALHRRQSQRRSEKTDDLYVECVIKHAKVRKLLQQRPAVSTMTVCLALDDLGQKLPWRKLSMSDVTDSRAWASHASNPIVKNTISRARKRAQKISDDIRYLRGFIRQKNPKS
jgi:hypothetical protein